MKTLERITIKPAPGRKVRKPSLQWLKERGEAVSWSPFWQRRLSAGDVVRVEKPAPSNVRTSAKRPPKKESDAS